MDNVKILVICGQTQLNDLIINWLGQNGYSEVYASESGINALAKSELIEPDLFIINVELPDMSGFDLCLRLKSSRERALILCVSWAENESERIRAAESGVDDYHAENGDIYELLTKVKNLARVKRLTDQIRVTYAEIEKRNRLMDKHISLARSVQRAFIPAIDAKFNDCYIISAYHPAMGVGGDFFNVIRLDENAIGLVMGDVSGHGIASSFLTVTLNIMVKNLALKSKKPSDLLRALNNDVIELFDSESADLALYACVFYAVIDFREKTVSYANSGLTLPVYNSKENGACFELEVSGMPIGMIKNSSYREGALNYSIGDSIFIYTDGLQDYYYKEQPDEFSRLLRDMLNDLNEIEAKNALDSIRRTFYKTDATPNERMEMDDVSMLLCKFFI